MSYKLLINGALVDGAAPSFDVINPATEEVLAQCPKADIDQLEEAVAAAKAAFPSWAARPIGERAALLNKLADAIEAKQDEFSRVLTEEQGKPLPFAAAEVAGSISNIRYFASLQIPRNVLVDDGKSKIIQHYTPLGVVAAITPWNFPLLLVIMKLAPALMAGNTLVAKPAPTTPLTMLKLGELCAGIFPGRGGERDRRSERPRRRADRAQGRRQDRLHRLDRDREEGHGECLKCAEAHHPGTRRQ